MRLTRDDLGKITGYRTGRRQVEWFREHFGVEVPHDRTGPIMTDTGFEALLAKRLGLEPPASPPAPEFEIHLPASNGNGKVKN